MEVMYHVNKEVVVEQPQLWRPDGSENVNSDAASEPVKNDGYSENSSNVYLDMNEGNILEWPLLDKTQKVEDIDIPKLINSVMNTQVAIKHKDKIASPLSSQTSSSSSGESTTTNDTQSEKPLRIDLVDEESDEDVLELEFERASEKVHTHTPYCPNCSSQITKVILRRRKREDPTRSTVVADAPRREKPVDLFGCLSCFSIFIPSGNVLNPFRLFGVKGKQESAQIIGGEHASHADLGAVPGASVNADVSTTTIKQVNAFNLFWIFRRKKEDEAAPAADSKGKRVGESSGEHRSSSLNNSSGALPLSAPHVPISEGYLPPSDIVRYGAAKPGSIPEIAPMDDSVPSDHLAINVGDGTENVIERGISDARGSKPVGVVKCIVYGGLLELITSLSVVSSAAASGASTLNIMALGLAALISAIFVFGHNLVDLKNEMFKQDVDEQQTDRYQELLGKRGHFYLHATLALFSFLFFGLVPPLVYAFAFYESDNRDYKILAVAVASFPCIVILAVGQAYVKRTQKLSGYTKVVMYYLAAAITASGVAYATGDLLNLLMERLGWFGAGTPAAGGSGTPTPAAWASY